MKRYTPRNNPFAPYSRHGMSSPSGHSKSPRSPRNMARRTADFFHDHVLVSIVILALCLYAAWYLFNHRQLSMSTTPSTTTSSTSSSEPVLEKGVPDYDTVVPKGRTAANIDWTRVSPPDHNPVYTYVDTVGKATINVSEQPIPNDFKADPTKSIEQLAAGYDANQKITVGTVTVYIGTSTKGPQSVIFIEKNVLVLIKTDVGLTTDQWMSYISNLQ